MNLDELVTSIMERPGPLRLVAVDGPGGAGKSTFAGRLSDAAGGAPIIHTDDFAAADNPVNWWPRLLEQVIEPFARGGAAHYQRYDWPSESLAEWNTVEPAPIVIIEGVSAGRAEWFEHLSFVIWIETPPDERLRRGVERDGDGARDEWVRGMAAEDAHYRRDPTRERADVVIDGIAGWKSSGCQFAFCGGQMEGAPVPPRPQGRTLNTGPEGSSTASSRATKIWRRWPPRIG